jgi:hypothetical protein
MIYVSGWHLKSWVGDRGAEQTFVTYIAQVDLKELPQKILEMSLEAQPEIVGRLSKYLESRNK